MLLLFFASVVSWWIIAQRFIFFRHARHEHEDFEAEFWSGIDLSQLYREGNSRIDEGKTLGGPENVFRAGFKEFSRLRQQAGGSVDSDAVMKGAQRAMRVALSREQDRLDSSLGFLATVGSTSPYVGLFGTVWGIMNAFRGIGASGTASLVAYAPGIAEALIATAMGLFAAIPAVIAYNHYADKVVRLEYRYDGFMEEFSSILHRHARAKVR